MMICELTQVPLTFTLAINKIFWFPPQFFYSAEHIPRQINVIFMNIFCIQWYIFTFSRYIVHINYYDFDKLYLKKGWLCFAWLLVSYDWWYTKIISNILSSLNFRHLMFVLKLHLLPKIVSLVKLSQVIKKCKKVWT